MIYLKKKKKKLDFEGYHKESKNSAVTNICSVGLNHDVELPHIKWSQKFKPFLG